MPPAKKKQVAIVIFDVNCEKNFQEAANQCLMRIWATKWFSASSDTVKLILLNTAETNIENPKFINKATNLSEVTELTGYDPNTLHQHIKNVEVGNGDWVVGLALALEDLKNIYDTVKGIVGSQIIVVSDFSQSPKEFKPHQINYIKTSLAKWNNCYLYVLGPKVKVPTHMSSFDDVQRWSTTVEFLEEASPSLNVVKEIVEATPRAVVCDLELGEQLVYNYRVPVTMQKWAVPLTIGTQVTIPSTTTRFLKAVQPPKMKEADVGEGYWCWHLKTDLSIEVPYDNVIGGVYRHGKFIPLTKDVENNFKSHEARGFKIIAFTKRQNVSETILCGDGSLVVEGSNSKNFELLLRLLVRKNLCAIAKRIYYANCKPKLYALFPNEQDGVLIATLLPYGGNVVGKGPIEQDLREATPVANPALPNVYNFLDKLDVMNVAASGSVKVPLGGMMINPIRLSVIYQQLNRKYLGEDIIPEDLHSYCVLDDYESYVHLCPAPEPET